MSSYKYTDKDRIKAFWRKVTIEDLFDCWQWTGSTTHKTGYGQMKWDGRLQVASMIAWQLAHGVIPEGLLVLHKCDNRLCVNPNHLFLGTSQDNMDDMKRKGRSCDNNGERNPAAKLKELQVGEIRKKYSQGIKQYKLGQEYGVTRQAIWQIVHNVHWRNSRADPN